MQLIQRLTLRTYTKCGLRHSRLSRELKTTQVRLSRQLKTTHVPKKPTLSQCQTQSAPSHPTTSFTALLKHPTDIFQKRNKVFNYLFMCIYIYISIFFHSGFANLLVDLGFEKQFLPHRAFCSLEKRFFFCRREGGTTYVHAWEFYKPFYSGYQGGVLDVAGFVVGEVRIQNGKHAACTVNSRIPQNQIKSIAFGASFIPFPF